MRYIVLLILLAAPFTIIAQTKLDSSKLEYTLFHPTPRFLMRRFETDRPDVTESPYTVDAGHFQYETDLFKTDQSNSGGIKTIINSYNAANLKLGITNSLDLQLIVESYTTQKTTEGLITQKKSGFGNLTLRVKQNLWGNDNGKTAFALLPYVVLPTTSNAKITGGLVLPLSVSLPNDWDFGTELETSFEENQFNNRYHLNFQVTATISHELFTHCDFFFEGLINRNNELKNDDYSVNSGLIYELEKNLNIDTGIYYGLKNTSSKVYFIGMSFRY